MKKKIYHGEFLCEIVIPSMLCILAFIFYFWLLTKDFLIPGVDGPYYLIQVEAILNGKGMVYGDPPFIFYLASLFASLLNNVRVGIAFAVSLMISLTFFPAYWLFKRVSENYFSAAIGSILIVFSPQMVRLAGDLMKNAAGVFFLILSANYVLALLEDWSFRKFILAVLSAFFTFLTHSLDAALSLFFMFTCLIGIILYCKLESRVCPLRLLGLFFSFLFLILVTSLIFPYYFSDVNKGIAFIRDVFFSGSSYKVPGLFKPKPARTWPTVTFFELAYVLPFLVAGIILTIDAYKRRLRNKFILLFSAVLLILLCILPSLLGLRDWAWRFMLMSFIPIAFILGSVSLDGNQVNFMVLMIILALYILVQTANATLLVRPTISVGMYNDLLRIRDIMGDNISYRVAFGKGWSRYWPEYLFGKGFDSKPIYLIVPKDAPSPPLLWKLIYDGKTLRLFKIAK